MRHRSDLFSLIQIYKNPTILSMGLIGFSSGLPLFLTASTLALWLKHEGVSYTNIGLMSLVALPYSIKFLWAPFIDCVKLPILHHLGQRKGWLLFAQVILLCCTLAISFTDPSHNLLPTIVCAILISFAAATQEIVMLAYQVNTLSDDQYGAGEAMCMLGYRIGMLFSGAGALYLASYMSWQCVYQVITCFMIIGIFTTLSLQEPTTTLSSLQNCSQTKQTFAQYIYKNVYCPFLDFIQNKECAIIIAIMLSYKLGDNLIGNMSNIFYIEMGFSKNEIASASKVFGMITTIIGGIIGSAMIHKFGTIKSLIFTILLHGSSILLFILVAKIGYNLNLLYFTIAIEHITGGMRTTALLSFQLTLINPKYAATQLAVFTSLSHFGRTIAGSSSGWIIDHFGWINFFTICASSTIVSLIFVIKFMLTNQGRKCIRNNTHNVINN